MQPTVMPSRTLLLAPLALALRVVPNAVHEAVFTAMVNHLLKGQPLADELGPLDGKRIRLTVSDTGSEITFFVRGRGLAPCRTRGPDDWDVRIRGALEDFWRLAARIEDPDTLFFHRRLDLEGETEAGLYLKNLLDAMEFDWQAHVKAVLGRPAGQALVSAMRRLRLDRTLGQALQAAAPPVGAQRPAVNRPENHYRESP